MSRKNLYESLKSILKLILPFSFYHNIKPYLRRTTSIIYSGSNHECNLCGFRMRKMQTALNGNNICPKCGSTDRNRSVFYYINKHVRVDKKMSVLHFSPTNTLRKVLSKLFDENYISSDYSNEFKADVSYDIKNIPLDKGSTNIIICMHVLEHIENDTRAMHELYRILSGDGICLIQTPFKQGGTYENQNIKTPEERKLHFGQEDHVRIYSADDLKLRLENVGFSVSSFLPDDHLINFHVLSKNQILVCKKNRG